MRNRCEQKGDGSQTIVLPFPPSGNRYWRSNRGRVHLADAAHDYRQVVAVERMRQKVRPCRGQIAVVAVYGRPDRRKRDLDNCWKQLGDALEWANVYSNDSQIVDLRLMYGNVRPGYVEVTISECSASVELSCWPEAGAAGGR
ncbi:RusA family crossover junction endodeoxyribonuclease [Oceanidesulfovibrio marinus]|uniref:Uncharacterized protein n=1 Tax=Oceanidesulfovibrio marinus TaxID=370038 RepID=A0A6P1ZMG3_9BACT|nr:RusA family crossover junction endodeoxyribonuclease [Oceanidesulfovibrio marinus]TVM35625.1 hypothetical protein DQK91_02875 [Oceanidesulfovibrio marinus]